MKIIVSSFILVAILLSSSFSAFINVNAQLKPNAIVSPSCGDVTGYGMKMNVNGFEPNSNVGWKVVHPETQSIPTYGYFSTNSTGGFSESAYIESESGLVEGKYEIQFFDDADNDSNPDPGKKEFIVSMSVPCEKE
ncbi:MAG TPA: hypothetical protein VFP49_01855 [Nitrososphaeraceae archaeon]|jgi:hypothetical protein|nr:hypothetical protein [Nitrososphaeraceae archaeon]